MRIISTFLLLSSMAATATAQSTITNGGFENWGGNPAPGVTAEPTNWYSNKSGSSVAAIGPQTCFQDNTIVHSGTASVRVQNGTVAIIGTVVNGNVTTGVINAPTTTKTDGYIGTRNYSDTTDVRHMLFTGKPDSLAGWFQYTSGGTGEQGKVRAILHTGDYYDPETASTYHHDASANKIADALFLTPTGNTSTWTRFSVPFNYVNSTVPQYIMINITSSNDQNTTFGGSKLWIDDLEAIYTSTSVTSVSMQEKDINVYSADKTLFVTATAEMSNTILTIYDMTGKAVFTQNLNDVKFSNYDLSGLATGIYVYKVNNTSFSKTGKVAIQ